MQHITRLEFNGQKYATRELLARTAFSRRDIPVLARAIRTFEAARGCGSDVMLIGGAATRMYTSGDLTGRVASLEATDVDVVLKNLKPEVEATLKVKQLVDKVTRTLGSFAEPTLDETISEFSCFVFRDGTHPDLKDVDLFFENVGPVVVRPEDNDIARTITMVKDDGTELAIKVADPGLLIATLVNPAAFTETRLRRAAFVLTTLSEEARNIGKRCGEVLSRTPGFDQNALEPSFKQMIEHAGRLAADAVREFIGGVRETLTA